MKQYFVISDVHGYTPSMLRSLENAGFDWSNDDHILIINGDLFSFSGYIGKDGRLYGYEPLELFNLCINNPDKIIAIKGNHDEDLVKSIDRLGNYRNKTDIQKAKACGDWYAFERFRKAGLLEDLRKYVNKMPTSIEINGYLISHSGNPDNIYDPLAIFDRPTSGLIHVVGHMWMEMLIEGRKVEGYGYGYISDFNSKRVHAALDTLKFNDNPKNISYEINKDNILNVYHDGDLSYVCIDRCIFENDQPVLIIK